MIWLILIGVAAGALGGLLGLGGGVLFVPGLVIVIGLSQHRAEATSLLAIVPVGLCGALLQDRYGNVRRGDALLLGIFSVAGVAGGVALANALSGKALRDAFAGLMIVIAAQLVRRTLRARAMGEHEPASAAASEATDEAASEAASEATDEAASEARAEAASEARARSAASGNKRRGASVDKHVGARDGDGLD